MCGRFSLFAPWADVEERFAARFVGPYERRYNAAPGQSLPVIRDVAPDRITTAEWGLQPAWAEQRSDGGFVNARAETVGEKPSFRAAMAGAGKSPRDGGSPPEPQDGKPAAGRCLVPADGYYEWAGEDGGRQPYRIQRSDGELFAMAGLWTRWSPTRRQRGLSDFADGSDGDGDAETGGNGAADETVETFAIVTTAPNDVAGQVHERMPAILGLEQQSEWLTADGGKAAAMLGPSRTSLEAYAISTTVNDASNDHRGILEPIED